MGEIEIVRRAYAKQILAVVGARNQALEDAFAAVAREAFLGSGPWPILRWGKGYVLSPDDDPVYLYSNDLVGIDLSRNLNNGQPSWQRWSGYRGKSRRLSLIRNSLPAPR